MRYVVRGAVIVLIALSLTGCASCGGAARRPSDPRSDVITLEEIQRGQWSNVYDLVRALRPRWLRTRGPDTILGTPGEVQAHIDGARLGGVNALRSVPVAGISYIQFFDPTTSAARWGLGHGHGTVYISTRPQ